MIYILFILLMFNSILFSTNSISINGKIILFQPVNLDEDNDDEIFIYYQNNETNLFISIYDYENNQFKKIYDENITEKFSFYFFANLTSKSHKDVVLVNPDNVYFLKTQNNYKLEKAFPYKGIIKTFFENNLEYIECAHDINNDGYSEIFFFDKEYCHILDINGNLIDSLLYRNESINNFDLMVGGFRTLRTLIKVVPEIKLADLNKDGFNDVIFIYRDGIEYYIYNDKNKKFNKGIFIDLSRYVNLRSGYSPFNKHIIVEDYDGDGFQDILLFNFNMATLVNTDKQGTMFTIFFGNKNTIFSKFPNIQIFLNNISGIESKFLFSDINNDKKLDFVNIGTKLLSSDFLLNLTVKRSLTLMVDLYLQDKNLKLATKPTFSLQKNISLDSEVLNSSTADFNNYITGDVTRFIFELFINFYNDFNNDGIKDMIIYNFNATYSIYLSDKRNNSIYNLNMFKNLNLDKSFINIFLAHGPYLNTLKLNNKIYFGVFNNFIGKVFFYEF